MRKGVNLQGHNQGFFPGRGGGIILYQTDGTHHIRMLTSTLCYTQCDKKGLKFRVMGTPGPPSPPHIHYVLISSGVTFWKYVKLRGEVDSLG